MLRHPLPVATATDTTRTRAGRPRPASRRRHALTHESVSPNDFGLGQLFGLSRDAVVVGNLYTRRITLWNPAAERLFGWSAAEAVGQSIEMLIPAAILRVHEEELALSDRSGYAPPIDSSRPREVALFTRSGQEIRVEVSIADIAHPSGVGRFVLAMLRDVSDRRRAEMQNLDIARAEEARDQAEQALCQHQQLTREAADELRSELQLLRRSTQRLGQQINTPHPQRLGTRARVIEMRTERLRKALDGFATRVQIQSGQFELSLERVNLVPLVSRVVAETRSRSSIHKFNMAMPQGLTALVDPARIAQVVQALLDQAMARCPRGAWIDIDLRRPLVGLAQLEIHDYGRAVSEDTRRRLLETSTSDPTLALCRSIVEQHGGTLCVEFPADGGTRVSVTVPTQRGRVTASPGAELSAFL